jgi:hypothetical protein
LEEVFHGELNLDRRNMKADEGKFLDRINKTNMIFDKAFLGVVYYEPFHIPHVSPV